MTPFERLPAFAIAGVLALLLVCALFVSSAVGRRRADAERVAQLGPLETMASGLLGLLLAFNFSVAQTRFDARQQLLIAEADAIGTAYLRCSVLTEGDRQSCREQLHRYAALRIAAYEAYGRAEDLARLSSSLTEGEKIQDELWATAARAARAKPDPPHALLMSALNELIDLDSDRRASIRMLVPQAVTASIILACLAWAVLLGYSAGARNAGSWAAWIVVALLISIVFGVALDLDRPRSGFVTTKAAERSMQNVLRTMEKAPVD